MKIKAVTIKNFRGAITEKTLHLEDSLTVVTGRNDAGKSTFLDALDIFFSDRKPSTADFSRIEGVAADEFYVEVVFGDIPESIVIDSNYQTSLMQERLLNASGDLCIRKTYTPTGTPRVSIRAAHPILKDGQNCSILNLGIDKLKKLAQEYEIDLTSVDKTKKAEIRKEIYKYDELFILNEECELRSENFKSGSGKEILEKIKQHFPVFNLFKAENVADENENFIQDPAKAVVGRVLSRYSDKLEKISEAIEEELSTQLTAVADELAVLAPSLETNFSPHNLIPNWEKAYSKVAFMDGNGVQLSSRGSGMKRLALLSFFKVSARSDTDSQNIVYAVEEPEAFLHPDLQREIWQSLSELAEGSGIQVLITSHSANLIELTDVQQVRLLSGAEVLQARSDEAEDEKVRFVEKIESTLGKFRDTKIDCFLLVEGRNDLVALKKLLSNSKTEEFQKLNKHYIDGKFAIMPIGGTGSFSLWSEQGPLESFGKPVVFLRDLDDKTPVRFEVGQIQEKLAAKECFEVLHSGREMENELPKSHIIDTLSRKWYLDSKIFKNELENLGLDKDFLNFDIPKQSAIAYYRAKTEEEVEPSDSKLRDKERVVKRVLADSFGNLSDSDQSKLLESNFGRLVRSLNFYFENV